MEYFEDGKPRLGQLMYRFYTKPRMERDPEYKRKFMEYHRVWAREHYNTEARKVWYQKNKDRINEARRAKDAAMTEEERQLKREKDRLRYYAKLGRQPPIST